MSPSPRFLYLGFLVPDADRTRIFAGEVHPQVSALRFQHNLLGALEGAGAVIDAVTTPPIASFPRNRNLWVSGTGYEVAGLRLRARQTALLNLPGVRLLMRLAQCVRHGLALLPADGVLVYSVHSPMVAASLVLKRLRGVPVFVFIPDVPTFMGGPSNPLKRFLKRLDASLVRRMLSHADGAFPVTEGTGRDWLMPGARYWAMEGISDHAAAVLEAARERRSYVFEGSPHPPKLLYTGALEQVLTFAHAFHRSAIDAVVTFMGGGPDATGLRELAARDPRIIVKPFATGTVFAAEVEAADFMLNPRDPAWPGSGYSFPSKLFEYLAYGKPIISTQLSGVPPAYFGVFRPIVLSSQTALEASLVAALRPDEKPDAVWSAAEQLADRLRSRTVGPSLLAKMAEWSGAGR